jgi:hypothetical protein
MPYNAEKGRKQQKSVKKWSRCFWRGRDKKIPFRKKGTHIGSAYSYCVIQFSKGIETVFILGFFDRYRTGWFFIHNPLYKTYGPGF